MGQATKQSNFTLNILNGLSIGIVVTLIPSAIFGSIMKLFGTAPVALEISQMLILATNLLPVVAGFAVASLFKYGNIEAASVALAGMVGSGVAIFTDKGFVLAGTGDIINLGITVVLAVLMIQVVGDKLGQFKMLLLPAMVIMVAGGIGTLTLPYVRTVSQAIGQAINAATTLQPILMGIIVGMAFAALVVSPISSAGIATAIGITGIGAGSANLGIVAASFTLAAMGASVNPIGGTLAHFIGSPKIQMANMLSKPKLFIPALLAAGIAGGVGAIFQVEGTSASAGFGFSGLLGPIAAITTGSTLIEVIMIFVVVPVILAFTVKYIFISLTNLVKPSDLKLPELS